MRPPYSQMSLVHPLVRAVGDSLAVSCIGMGTIEDRPLEEAVLRANVAEATLASTSICVTWVCGSHKPLLRSKICPVLQAGRLFYVNCEVDGFKGVRI
jgi:hypothetical protein